MPDKQPHVPTKNERERTTGHKFYYSRDDRLTLPNAPGSHRRSGLRRFTLLFFDILLLVGGVTVIRKCAIDSGKESGTRVSTALPVTNGRYYGSAVSETGSDIREIRLTVRRTDGTQFLLSTNRQKSDWMSADLIRSTPGGPITLPMRHISPGTELISHQFFRKLSARETGTYHILWNRDGGQRVRIPVNLNKRPSRK